MAGFTELEKINIRRHCGFGFYGNGSDTSPPSLGYRYDKWYLILEYRMLETTMSDEERDIVRIKYLAPLENLESAILTASSNLDTDRAAVWWHNKNEVSDRYKFYKLWCNRLIDFMQLSSPSPMLANMSIVV